MAKRQTVFKVVLLDDDGHYTSAIHKEDCKVTYRLGKSTRAKVGRLFVFGTLPDAVFGRRQLVGSNEPWTILECVTASEVRVQTQCYDRPVWALADDLIKWWNEYEKPVEERPHFFRYECVPTPYRTLTTKTLTPKREVSRGEISCAALRMGC